MLSPIIDGCTLSLASEIADQRIRHAAERDDFHCYFHFMTVGELQSILRNRAPREVVSEDATQSELLTADLLSAQQGGPHRLWTLLLLVAFERELVDRRRALSPLPDVALDHLVVETFVAAVEDIPLSCFWDELPSYVLGAWGRRLKEALRGRPLPRAPRITEPPPSAAVVCTGDNDNSLPYLASVTLAPRVFPGDAPYTALLIHPAVTKAVCGAFWRFGWPMFELADGLQEVRYRAIRSFHRGLKPPATVKGMRTYCARIARNHATDLLEKKDPTARKTRARAKKADATVKEEVPKVTHPDAGLCENPDEYIPLQLSHEQRDPVDAGRQLEMAAELFRRGRMPEHGLDILEGVACEATYEDLAADLGITSDAVQGRLKKMRKLFKQQVATRNMR